MTAKRLTVCELADLLRDVGGRPMVLRVHPAHADTIDPADVAASGLRLVLDPWTPPGTRRVGPEPA